MNQDLLTLHRCKKLLNGQKLLDARAIRESEIDAGMQKIFGAEDWEPLYRDFCRKIESEREIGLAHVPLIALNHRTNVSELAVALVAKEILDFRRGEIKKSPAQQASDKLKGMMDATRPTIRRTRQR